MTSPGHRLVETITLSRAKQLIKCLAHEQSLLLLSPPGVGKSDVVAQAAAEAGLPCRSLLGTQIAPEDVSGIPRIVGERSVFCPPRVLLPERPEPFCLFLDELPACAPDIQKAFYALLLERRLGEHRLPAGTWVVAAGNRLEDRALVRSLSSALINRVTILHIRVDVIEWLAWAEANGVRQDIRNFVAEDAGRLLRPVPAPPAPFSTPRAWAALSQALDLAEAAGALDEETVLALAAGRVSLEDAERFATALQLWFQDVKGRRQVLAENIAAMLAATGLQPGDLRREAARRVQAMLWLVGAQVLPMECSTVDVAAVCGCTPTEAAAIATTLAQEDWRRRVEERRPALQPSLDQLLAALRIRPEDLSLGPDRQREALAWLLDNGFVPLPLETLDVGVVCGCSEREAVALGAQMDVWLGARKVAVRRQELGDGIPAVLAATGWPLEELALDPGKRVRALLWLIDNGSLTLPLSEEDVLALCDCPQEQLRTTIEAVDREWWLRRVGERRQELGTSLQEMNQATNLNAVDLAANLDKQVEALLWLVQRGVLSYAVSPVDVEAVCGCNEFQAFAAIRQLRWHGRVETRRQQLRAPIQEMLRATGLKLADLTTNDDKQRQALRWLVARSFLPEPLSTVDVAAVCACHPLKAAQLVTEAVRVRLGHDLLKVVTILLHKQGLLPPLRSEKIRAIKAVRDFTAAGLKEAKDAVEAVMNLSDEQMDGILARLPNVIDYLKLYL